MAKTYFAAKATWNPQSKGSGHKRKTSFVDENNNKKYRITPSISNFHKNMDVEIFVKKFRSLIELERSAEQDKFSESPEFLRERKESGNFLCNLVCLQVDSIFFTRLLVTFGVHKGKLLPSGIKLSKGDPVVIGSDNPNFDIERNGVIYGYDAKTVTVVMDKSLDVGTTEKYFLYKLPNDTSYTRMDEALGELFSANDIPLVKVAFGQCEPHFNNVPPIDTFPFVNQNLNEIQKEAIVQALASREVFIIHGPPGTGKTTTLVEIIQQLVMRKQKVLVCAGSNSAVDNITEKTWQQNKKIKMVRLGHISRFHPGLYEFSLDGQLNKNEMIHDLRNDLKILNRKLADSERDDYRHLMAERRSLSQDLHKRETKATESLLKHAKVVFSTVFFDQILKRLNKKVVFDVVIVDECSQITEPACWIPLLQAKQCVLAGDHCQLPPVIHSEKASRDGLNITLMKRLIEQHGDLIMKMLTIQYRMNKKIMSWPSTQFYDNKLIAHHSVSKHLLQDLPHVYEDENTSQAIVVLDTVATNCFETCSETADESRGNHGEADLVAFYVDNLIESGVQATEIGVISPYSLQVSFIKSRLSDEIYKEVEVRSVDGFQGREKECIVLSMVRSNEEGSCGFLSDQRRINVAVTRAKRHLAVICNSKTISSQPFFKDFLEYVKTGGGEIRSAVLYEDVIGSYDREEKPTKEKDSDSKENQPERQSKLKKKIAKAKVKAKPVAVMQFMPDHQVSAANCRMLNSVFEIDRKLAKSFKEFIEGPESALKLSNSPKKVYDAAFPLARENDLDLSIVVEMDGSKTLVLTKKLFIKNDDEGHDPDVDDAKNSYEANVYGYENIASGFAILDKDGDNNDNISSQNSASDYESIYDDIVSPRSVVGLPEDNDEEIRCSELGIVDLDKSTSMQKNICDAGKDSCEHIVSSEHVPNTVEDCGNDNCIATSASAKSLPKKKKKSAALKPSNTLPKTKLKQFPDMNDTDDFNTLVDSVVRADKECSMVTCRFSVLSYLPCRCDFCNRRYCLSHFMPEIHGCGPAAKASARSQIRKEGVIYPGSAKPNRKPKEDRKNQLQATLKKKLDKCSDERKRKPKKN